MQGWGPGGGRGGAASSRSSSGRASAEHRSLGSGTWRFGRARRHPFLGGTVADGGFKRRGILLEAAGVVGHGLVMGWPWAGHGLGMGWAWAGHGWARACAWPRYGLGLGRVDMVRDRYLTQIEGRRRCRAGRRGRRAGRRQHHRRADIDAAARAGQHSDDLGGIENEAFPGRIRGPASPRMHVHDAFCDGSASFPLAPSLHDSPSGRPPQVHTSEASALVVSREKQQQQQQ